jgi:hypothetical protein
VGIQFTFNPLSGNFDASKAQVTLPGTLYTSPLQLNYAGGVTAFQVVGPNGSGQVTLVTASLYENFPPIGITTAAVSNGTFYPFVYSGIVTNPLWSFTPGQVMLSDTGSATQNATGLGLISIIGWATSADSFYFAPQGHPLTRITA